ncbi:MAG: amidohydrolase [Desulfurococcaceae archaeon]
MPTGFINGVIYASFKPLRRVEALLIVNGRVIYAGDREVVETAIKVLGGELLDLGGRVVLPGFIDSHVHLDELGIYLNTLDLRGVRSIAELKEKLRKHAERTETTWILGHGWDQELFEEKRWPTRWDLDEVVIDKPVMLTRICLHAAVLNTKAMELTGLLNAHSLGVVRDENGVPTGIVKEEAFDNAREKFKETLTESDYEKFIEDATRYAASQGVTTVGFVSCDERSLKALSKLREEGRLSIRVRVYLSPGRRVSNCWEILEALKKLSIRRGFGDDMLKIMGVKILVDGSLGARTAWLTKPYSDDPSTSGCPNISEEALESIVKEAHEAGLQVAIHGIGDRAIDMIISVFKRLRGVERRRHRVEHASVLREDQVEEMSKLGITVSAQPHFIITDWWAEKRLGKERARWLYSFKTMMEKGIVVGFGTDSPVEPLNPWETIYAAVTRGKYEGISYYESTAKESLTLEEALQAYTWGSAYIMFEEDLVGLTEEGLADFIIIDKDPFAIEERELKNVRILETYINGKRIWP